MLADPLLHPENRMLYSQHLQPPTGYLFDAGIATTYSMDFETALAVPVSLTLHAAEDRSALLDQPLALLEGAQRVAKKLLVFADAGRIHARPAAQSRLISLLESSIVEVLAPNGGAFHPKLWLLRFKPSESGAGERLRLLVLSRNLTADRSWDIALSLDGDVTERPVADNRPLAELISRLPGLALSPISAEQDAWVRSIADQVRRTRWELPPGFDSVTFAVNGLGGRQWRPAEAAKLGIISPFCDEQALRELSELPYGEKAWLIGRSDQLAAIGTETLNLFEHVSVLDDMGTSGDGSAETHEALEGLHAKIYVSERGWDTAVTVGSGNATCAALKNCNVEVFATLTGKRSQVGGVAKNLGPEGFGRLVRRYVPGEVAPTEAGRREGEQRLREMHRAVCKAGLRLRCERVAGETAAARWRTVLVPPASLSLAHEAELEAWPITVAATHATSLTASLALGQPAALASVGCAEITAFVGFRLVDATSGQSLLFSCKLPVDGLPPERDSAVLCSVIENRRAFFAYLRLLLADTGELSLVRAGGASLGGGFDGSGGRGVAGDDMPMLEELVRAFCRGDARALDAIDNLLARLDAGFDDGSDPVPDGFRELWRAFRAARGIQEPGHDGI